MLKIFRTLALIVDALQEILQILKELAAAQVEMKRNQATGLGKLEVIEERVSEETRVYRRPN